MKKSPVRVEPGDEIDCGGNSYIDMAWAVIAVAIKVRTS